ncbi:helix-turn-helix domain-containing protein [Macrococcus psychrotolerans]|uniref:helix-turn-helix domain-containing protein n=1 Tax=Staphylococcaceae TaxID=90964 RepID=UPI003C12B9B8
MKWHRENLGYSSGQVALCLGIHKTTYSKMENFKRVISASDMKIIANFFNISMDELCSIPLKNKHLNKINSDY